MGFGRSTSATLLARSDSKNPATTCKGITVKGLPCRRDLSAATTSFYGRHHNVDGVIAVLDAGHAAAFFCHDHRNQADALVESLRTRSEIVKLKKRSSVDTLIERFGVIDLDDDQRPRARTNQTASTGHVQHVAPADELPQKWRTLPGPLMVVPEEVFADDQIVREKPNTTRYHTPRHPPPRQTRRSNVKASWNCCIQIDESDNEDNVPSSRRRGQGQKRSDERKSQSTPARHSDRTRPMSEPTTPIRRKPVSPHNSQAQSASVFASRSGQSPYGFSPVTPPSRPQLQPRHSSSSPPNSQTVAFLSYIPPHLSPEVTSALLTELSKPISPADKAGYIYIYWLTPESDASKPDVETASSLLDGDDYQISPEIAKYRRSSDNSLAATRSAKASEALQRYASVRRTQQEQRKILLKIGRSSNVHRRLTQWTRQCGQNITLVRSYPYDPMHSPLANLYPNIGSGKKVVPYASRVERLIHLELTEKRVADKGECDTCGKTHREWFEVAATKQAVREIDEVIRRWVNWAETIT